MTRSAARRTTAVSAEKSSLPIPPSGVGSSEAREPVPASAVPWYWRLFLFLWLTSFAFMLLYEWLAGILKSLRG